MATYYIDYQAYNQMNPETGKADLRCGRIVNRRLLSGKDLAEALQKKGVASWMTLEEFYGLMNAITAKKRELVLEGNRVKDDYTMTYLTMNGQLGVNDSIGPKTKISIKIDPRTDMKINDGDKFSCHNVDKIADVSINSLCTVGGTEPDVWKMEHQAIVTGTNLKYLDKVDSITWKCGDIVGTTPVVVDGSQDNSMTLSWNADWDDYAVGTEVTLTFTLHGGVAEATPRTITRTFKVAASI